MLWLVCFFNYADRQAIFSVFPLLKSEMNLSNVQLGVVGSAFMWVYALAGPLAGIVGDRFNRKGLIIGGLILWSLITMGTALSTTYWHLVLFRALEGFGEAFYFPASLSLISDYHGPDTRSRALGLHQSSVYLGTIAGGTVSGFLGQYWGWRSSFYLFGGLGLLLGFILVKWLTEPLRGQAEGLTLSDSSALPKRSSRAVSTDLKRILGNSMVQVLIAVFVGANFVGMIFLTWLPSFLFGKFGMSLSMAGFSGTAFLQIASVAGVTAGGFLADRLAHRYPGGRMLTQSIGLFLGAPFIFLTGSTYSIPALVGAMMGFGFCKGLYDSNTWASLYDIVKPPRRATALGLMNAVAWMGGGMAPVIIAAASQHYGMSVCLSATSIIYLLSGLLLIWGVGKYMRRPDYGTE